MRILEQRYLSQFYCLIIGKNSLPVAPKGWGLLAKGGGGYLRKLLIHGARSLLIKPKSDDYRRTWAHSLKERMGLNKGTVTLANRNARVI